ncbi:hypothetical protein BGZ98_000334 [Dissophora globulifera]|nr:hypothetical protein BGZ98_000334 [Dissophora globulifera]
MRLNTYLLALTLAASVQVLAEEVTLSVWHKLSDHETFEKRGEIRLDADSWLQAQQTLSQASASSSTLSSKQKQVQQQKHYELQKQQQAALSYSNVQLSPASAATFPIEFILNVQTPSEEGESGPGEREVDEEGAFTETEEEFADRVAEWHQGEEDRKIALANSAPGSYAYYQIQLREESRGWEATSSIKSCLLVASDFQEELRLHLDQEQQVFAFDYYAGESKCSDDHKKVFPLTSLDHFKNVRIELSTGQAGPKPRYTKAQAIKIDNTTGKPE